MINKHTRLPTSALPACLLRTCVRLDYVVIGCSLRVHAGLWLKGLGPRDLTCQAQGPGFQNRLGKTLSRKRLTAGGSRMIEATAVTEGRKISPCAAGVCKCSTACTATHSSLTAPSQTVCNDEVGIQRASGFNIPPFSAKRALLWRWRTIYKRWHAAFGTTPAPQTPAGPKHMC